MFQSNSIMRRRGLLVVLVLVCITGSGWQTDTAIAAHEGGLDPVAKELIKKVPPGWQVKDSFVASDEDTAAIGKKLGGRISELSNATFSVHGWRLQVNVFVCATTEVAERIHKEVLSMKDDPGFCLKSGKMIAEFVGDDVCLAIKAAYELGMKPKPSGVRYRISFQAAPLKDCDLLAWNRLFTLFFELGETSDHEATKAEIGELSKRFQFGKELSLRTCGKGEHKPAYSFTPRPARAQEHGEMTEYTFKDLPREMGVPPSLHCGGSDSTKTRGYAKQTESK